MKVCSLNTNLLYSREWNVLSFESYFRALMTYDRDYLTLASIVLLEIIAVIAVLLEYWVVTMECCSSYLKALWQKSEKIWSNQLIDRVTQIARGMIDNDGKGRIMVKSSNLIQWEVWAQHILSILMLLLEQYFNFLIFWITQNGMFVSTFTAKPKTYLGGR